MRFLRQANHYLEKFKGAIKLTNILEINDLTKRFGGIQALDGVSLNLNEKEIVGLIGPNGCGKSTTFNVMSGVMEGDGGSVMLYGEEVYGLPSDQINRLGMSRTYQDTRLWRDLTVIENLMLPPKNQLGVKVLNSLFTRNRIKKEEKEILEKAYDTLDLLEITHMANHYCSELSGGQSKLVDLGRVLMSDPKILLLDEPVAGVAGPLAEKIFERIGTLRDELGLSVLIIEHNMDFILQQGVDRVFVMSNGRVVVEGTPSEIQQSKTVIEAYLGE